MRARVSGRARERAKKEAINKWAKRKQRHTHAHLVHDGFLYKFYKYRNEYDETTISADINCTGDSKHTQTQQIVTNNNNDTIAQKKNVFHSSNK